MAGFASKERERNEPVKAFVQIPHSIIHVSGGHLDGRLQSNICEELSDDSNYRVREVTATAIDFMRHHHREKLCVSDFKAALHHNKVDPIYSDGYEDVVGTVLDLKAYAEKDEEYEECESYFSGKWLNEIRRRKVLKRNFKKYYKFVTRAILKGTDALCALALEDLKKNASIMPVVPFIVRFISSGMKRLGHVPSHSNKFLVAIHCLVCNPMLYLGHNSYLNILVHSILVCLVQEHCGYNHWLLRDRAAHLLAKILNDYVNTPKEVYNIVVSFLEDVFKDVSQPFCSHYGAIIALTYIGVSAIGKVISLHMSTYFRHLNNSLKFNSRQDNRTKHDACMVHGQLLLASELILYHCLHLRFRTTRNFTCNYRDHFYIPPKKVILKLLEYFGDALSARIPSTTYFQEQALKNRLTRELAKYDSCEDKYTILKQFCEKPSKIESNSKSTVKEDVSKNTSKKSSPTKHEMPPLSPTEDDNLCNLIVKELRSDPTSGTKLILKREVKKGIKKSSKDPGHGKSRAGQHSRQKKNLEQAPVKERKTAKKKKFFSVDENYPFQSCCGNLMIFL